MYLFINIEESKFFRYEGINVYCEIPITPFEAVLGANIEVPTLCGNVSMKIPPNTTTGQKFRLSEQGVEDTKTKKKGRTAAAEYNRISVFLKAIHAEIFYLFQYRRRFYAESDT